MSARLLQVILEMLAMKLFRYRGFLLFLCQYILTIFEPYLSHNEAKHFLQDSSEVQLQFLFSIFGALSRPAISSIVTLIVSPYFNFPNCPGRRIYVDGNKTLRGQSSKSVLIYLSFDPILRL